MWQTQICSLFLGGNSGLLPWNILKIGPSSSGSLGATATQKAPIDPEKAGLWDRVSQQHRGEPVEKARNVEDFQLRHSRLLFGIFRLHILHAPLWIFSISPGAPVGFPAVSKNLGVTILPIA